MAEIRQAPHTGGSRTKNENDCRQTKLLLRHGRLELTLVANITLSLLYDDEDDNDDDDDDGW